MKRRFVFAALFIFLLPACRSMAQDVDGPMSEAEIESLRESADTPLQRIRAYAAILDTRQKRVADLAARPHVGTAIELHDALDQMAAVIDELNDNLDEYAKHHRDVRKGVPKLLQAIDRWATAMRSAPPDDRYNVVKKLALDRIKDTRDIVTALKDDEDAYFKAHPEEEKKEKERAANPHAPTRE